MEMTEKEMDKQLEIEQSMGEEMNFPKTFKEFLDEYSFIDREEVYTNKSELIQTFRVEQGYEHFEKEIRADERKKIAEAILNYNALCKEVKDILLQLLERYEKIVKN